jgi:hypothetical protein
MAYYVKNISENFAWILKNQLGPGETLNLTKVFQGFCKPKAASRAEAGKAKFAEFKEDEFDEFLDWVQEEILVDKGVFELLNDADLPEGDESNDADFETKKSRRRAFRKAAKPAGDIKVRGDAEAIKEKRITHKQVGNKLPSQREISPKEIAWLPFDGVSKKIISDIDDMRRLKTAFRLVRNINGQERTRKLIEDRINELASVGR